MELKQLPFVKKLKSLKEKLKGKTLVAAALVLGIFLLLISSWGGGGESSAAAPAFSSPVFSLEEAQKQIEDALEAIDGAGKVRVLLTLKAGVGTELAENVDGEENSELVIISQGSGTEAPVIRRYLYPEYQGALIIAQGGGGAEMRLKLTEAVASLTGLASDRITVLKMREGRK